MRFPTQRLLNKETWLKIHFYLALIAGFFFALIGLTGSISLYRTGLDELLNPQLVIGQPLGKRQSLDKIMAAVQTVHPGHSGAWTLEMPSSPHGMITVWYDKPRETFFELYAPLMVSVNPYTAEVVASRFWGQTTATWLLDLHTQLRLDRFGWNAVAILGVLLIVSIGSGVYLWWPGVKKIRAALAALVKGGSFLSSGKKLALNQASLSTISRSLSRIGLMRIAFGLHRLVGLFSAPLLVLLALTGLHLSHPSPLETLTGASGMAHGETGRNLISTAQPNNHPVGLEEAEFVARAPFPRAELRRVATPAGDSGIYRINLRQGNEINRRHPYTTVWVDRWSGQIKELRDPSEFTWSEKAIAWIWPLHSGEAFGATGRLLWFFAGMSLPALYLSGLLRWMQRNNQSSITQRLRMLTYRLRERAYRTLIGNDHTTRHSLLPAGLKRQSCYQCIQAMLHLFTRLLQEAKHYAPLLIKGSAMLWHWGYTMIIKRQKRLEKK